MSDVVVLIDREQGGAAHLQKHNLKLHAAFTLSFIVDTLLAHKLLSAEVVDAVKRFIAENQTTSAVAGTAAGAHISLQAPLLQTLMSQPSPWTSSCFKIASCCMPFRPYGFSGYEHLTLMRGGAGCEPAPDAIGRVQARARRRRRRNGLRTRRGPRWRRTRLASSACS